MKKKIVLGLVLAVMVFSFAQASWADNKSANQRESKLMVAVRDYVFGHAAKPGKTELFRLIKTADKKDIEKTLGYLDLLQAADAMVYGTFIGLVRQAFKDSSLEEKIGVEVVLYDQHSILSRRILLTETALKERLKTLQVPK